MKVALNAISAKVGAGLSVLQNIFFVLNSL